MCDDRASAWQRVPEHDVMAGDTKMLARTEATVGWSRDVLQAAIWWRIREAFETLFEAGLAAGLGAGLAARVDEQGPGYRPDSRRRTVRTIDSATTVEV